MELARYVVDAVVVEGRGVREVARSHGVSKSWVSVLVARYRAGGYEALEPRSRRPTSGPTGPGRESRTRSSCCANTWSKRASTPGPGPSTGTSPSDGPRCPRSRPSGGSSPAGGSSSPSPTSAPRIRSSASRQRCPTSAGRPMSPIGGCERGRSRDLRHHRRPLPADRGRPGFVTGSAMWSTTFHEAAATWGYPASVLTDNGAVFNGGPRGGVTVFEPTPERDGDRLQALAALPSPDLRQDRALPPDPQTILGQATAGPIDCRAPAQVDRFVTYYNEERPHRARGTITPRAPSLLWTRPDRDHRWPKHTSGSAPTRSTRAARSPSATTPSCSTSESAGANGTPIRLYVADLDIRVVSQDGKLLRELTLDTTRPTNPAECPALVFVRVQVSHDDPRHHTVWARPATASAWGRSPGISHDCRSFTTQSNVRMG